MIERDKLFRKTSLERLRSPERLDQAIQIIHPKDWLPLGIFGLLIFSGLLWSIFGRIPITVAGQGILLNPHQVIQLQSPIAGQIKSLDVQNGQCVKEDQTIATIDASALQQQLQQQQDRLAQLQQQTAQDRLIQGQRNHLEQVAIAAQQTRLEQQLADTQTLAPGFQAEGLAAVAEQRVSLHQQLQSAKELIPLFKEKFEKRRELAKLGAIAQDSLLQTEQDYRQVVQEVAKLEAQLKQLDFQAFEIQQRSLANQSTIAQIQNQLDELKTKSKQLEQENLTNVQSHDREIQELQRVIAQLKKQAADNGQIKASQSGCIIEITANNGQVVDRGSRLGMLHVTNRLDDAIESGVVYFAVKDGKKIQSGMKILVTPDTVKREQFGSVVGKVLAISPLPITREGATSVIGNSEVASQLLSQNGSKIEVIAGLTRDSSTYSRYRWSSSKGPNLKFTPGTTFTARVTVEEQAPITFLLPILRRWSGTN